MLESILVEVAISPSPRLLPSELFRVVSLKSTAVLDKDPAPWDLQSSE